MDVVSEEYHLIYNNYIYMKPTGSKVATTWSHDKNILDRKNNKYKSWGRKEFAIRNKNEANMERV